MRHTAPPPPAPALAATSRPHDVVLAAAAALGAVLGVALGRSSGQPHLGAAVGAALGALVAALATRRSAQRPAARSRRSSTGETPGELRDRIIALIADSVPDAVVLVSDVGTIHYSNPVARELFFEGQAPEGQNFIRLVSAAAAPLREALLGETDRFFSVEVEGRRESYHLSRRTFNMDDQPLTLLVVKYMTREIHRREVEVLKRVVRVISHEVNNSLAPISSLMHSARMLSTKLGHADKYQRMFDTIDERTSHLRTFLEGYAALARLPRPQFREANFAPLLSHLASLYPDLQFPSAPERHGWFDAAQIEQVLINLIKNAREAGSPASEIEVRVATGGDGSSDIEVLDRGPGFSAEALQNSLVPLYTTKPQGSGMGLALSREIVEAHRGSLDVSNRPDGGAWIRVHLEGRALPSVTDASRSRLTLTRG
jgi:two-component system nitrogen regulation sensor histidine kinase NtrY